VLLLLNSMKTFILAGFIQGLLDFKSIGKNRNTPSRSFGHFSKKSITEGVTLSPISAPTARDAGHDGSMSTESPSNASVYASMSNLKVLESKSSQTLSWSVMCNTLSGFGQSQQGNVEAAAAEPSVRREPSTT